MKYPQLVKVYHFFTIIIFFLISGCSAPGLDLSLKQPPSSTREIPYQEVLDLELGVDTFIDLRPQIRGSENQKWLSYFPGVLWINIGTEMPENYTAYSPYDSRPMKDTVTEAIAYALRNSEKFKEVTYLPLYPYKKTDYNLEGVLRRSYVNERGYYYGSSIYAWFLRIIGLPYVSYEVILEADLRLRDMSNLQIIWEGEIKGQKTDKYNNVYQLSRGEEGKHLIAYNFSRILDERMPDLIEEMIKFLKKYENDNLSVPK